VQVRVPTNELRPQPVLEAEQVVVHEHLSVAVTACADADRRHRDRVGHEAGHRVGYAFEDDREASRFGERHGGYTRIMRAGTRPGDRAPMVVLELVDRPEAPKEKSKESAKSEKAPKGEKASKDDKGEAAAPARKGRRKKAAAAAG